MAQIINTPIPDAKTPWENYSGEQVEKFLKEQLAALGSRIDGVDLAKGSYLALLNVDEASSMASVGIFANSSTYSDWSKDKEGKADLLLSSVEIPMGSGGGSGEASYIVKLVNSGQRTITATKKSDLVAKIRFTSQLYDPSDKSLQDTNEDAVLQIETKLATASEWKVAGTLTIVSQPAADTETYTTIDLSPYCVDGTQSVRMIATGNTSGKKTPYVNITVTLTNIQIEYSAKWENQFVYKAVAPTITIPVRVSGSIDKTLHMKVMSQNKKYTKEYDYALGKVVFSETPYNAVIDHPQEHGIFTIETWVTSGDTVKTEAVTLNIMCSMPGNTTPLLVLNDIANPIQNWSNVTAFSYAIYNPQEDSTDISFVLTNLESEKVIYSEQVLGVKNNEAAQLIFDLEIETADNNNFPASMSFSSGNIVLREPWRVVIDNSENFAPTSGADFYLNPRTRNNSEKTPGTIVNQSNGEQVDAKFEGFSYISDGWVVDKETNSRCLRVLDGAKVAIDYDAYSDDTPAQGLTIELDFATRNVTDESGILLQMGTKSTVDDYLVGLWVKAQESCFMTAQKRVDGSQNWIYQKDKRTHVAVNIVPNLYNQGTNYVRIFINGIISREFTYANNDKFWQAVDGIKRTGGIVIAPQGADLDVYALRVYKRSLSATDIRQNYLASFPTVAEKKAFKAKNDILGENGLISYAKAYEKYNTLLYKGKIPSLKEPTATVGDVVVHKVGDPRHSGTLHNITRKGQGSTSKKYWAWNIQSDFKRDDAKWVDETGVDHGKCYQNADGLPMAVKLVDKRNWASSPQSHKMGATRMYNDLYYKVVGKNEFNETEGMENCRVAVYEDPFLVFNLESEGSEPVFVGMGTFGSGKGDKPTFGYDAEKTPNFLMIEGSDNNPRLTKHQIPWIEGDVNYDEEEEGYVYAGTTSWDYDLGNLTTISRYIEAFNFVYLHSNRIKPFNGTYTQLKEAKDLDISYCYWVTKAESGSARYDMYFYDEILKTWVPGGTSKNLDGSHATLNLKTQMADYLPSDFASHETYIEWDKVNEDFITARKKEFGAKITNYFHKRDILFFMCLMKLIAACDNRAKNTYFRVLNNTSLIRAVQDDLDSILPVDNQGKLTKPYWVEEHDFDESLGKNYWNGEDNVLYNMMEACFATELRSMMKEILDAMAELGGGTVDGFWEKYFFSTNQYFPAVAYNEMARVGYEYAHYQMQIGNYNNDTDPITQSLGSQEEGERQWCKDRTIYMSSYAKYGEFNPQNPSGGNINYRSTEQMTVNFDLTMAMWLYPVVTIGQSTIFDGQRVKAGDKIKATGVTDSNTQNIVCGVNYMSDIGTWYDKPANETFAFNGKRIRSLIAGSDTKSDIHLKATSVGITPLAALRTLDVHNLATLTGTLDASKNSRLVSIDARGTKLTDVSLPAQEFLKTVKLPATMTDLHLDGQRGLEMLTLEGYANLQNVYLNQATCPKIDALTLIEQMYESTQIASVTILGVDWQDVSVETLTWLLDKQAKLTGSITLSENVTVDATLKMRMVGMWGNVDDDNNALRVTYTKNEIISASLTGVSYYPIEGRYTLKLAVAPKNGNDIVLTSWAMTENRFATIDPKTGVITVTKQGSKEDDDKATVTVTLQLSSGKVIETTREVYFYAYEAKLGDYIFANGTYGSDVGLTDSTPIGIIFYIDPTRTWAIAVALKDYGSRVWGLYNNAGDKNNGMAGIKLESNAVYNVYDLPLIQNISQSYTVNDANMRDEANTANDGFKAYHDLNTISDIGFDEITDVMWNTSVGHTILGDYLGKAGLRVGDKVARGQLHTLKIIAHRDYILQDANVNLPIPKRTDSQTMAENLASCISAVQASHANASKYQQYYYPAASYCYAYVPETDKPDEVVAEKFGEGRWSLASIGELSRCTWYHLKGYVVGANHNIFAKGVADLRFVKFNSSWQWSSSECTETDAWGQQPSSGQPGTGYGGGKAGGFQVRPVVAFKL